MSKFALADENGEVKEYEYDGKLLTEDAMFVHEKSGVGIARMDYELVREGNPKVIAAWMYILKRRAGEAVRWEDSKKWDLATFRLLSDDPRVLATEKVLLEAQLRDVEARLSRLDAPKEEPEAEEEPGKKNSPTPSKNGTTRKRATTST